MNTKTFAKIVALVVLVYLTSQTQAASPLNLGLSDLSFGLEAESLLAYLPEAYQEVARRYINGAQDRSFETAKINALKVLPTLIKHTVLCISNFTVVVIY